MNSPMRIVLPAFLLAVFSTVCLADESSAKTDRAVDFENDLIPVFTKHGCNAGACHGAAIGRGGFKLSLYGGNPAADYEAIVRQLEGRRVNLSQSSESLIVLKPIEYLEHGGGSVIDEDSESARLLVNWITQGAKYRSQRTLDRLEITPAKHVSRDLGGPTKLRATAHYADGTKRDVTRWTIFAAEDASAVVIDKQSAQSRVLRRGRHIVVARYLDQVLPVEFIVPLTDKTVDFTSQSRRNFIDDAILDSLSTLALPASDSIDDAAYLRRVTLDLTGRLPSVDRVNDFLSSTLGHRESGLLGTEPTAPDAGPDSVSEKDSPEASADGSQREKREALVDQLLQSEEFNQYWTLQLAKLLRIRPQPDDRQGAYTYHQWLAEQIQSGVGYDELARAVIMAAGDTHENGPANFYRTVDGPREQAELMSELFMGSRLRCANCHNHPLDHWTQDDYHGLAAIFAKIEGERVVKLKPSGTVIHPRTLEPAVPKIPGESVVGRSAIERSERGAINDNDQRQQLAEWLTDPENPYFAKAIVNRLWKRMMGRGLVEPADDFRATNPATHPLLLDRLADDFKAHGFDLRHTLKLIATSAAYARSADATPENRDDDRFYSHAARRPLEVEVLADAISDALGVAGKYGDQPAGTRAVALVDPKTKSQSLDILGRCGREESCESSTAAMGGLPQKLHMFNGALLNARIAAKGSRLNQLISSRRPAMEIVNDFYLVALSRRPTDQETRYWKEQLASVTSADDQRAFLEDFVWGLMTCNEFVTNH